MHIIQKKDIKRLFDKKRKRDSHKNDYGHCVILAGSKGLTGAGCLTALAALRIGAGLVTLCIPKSLNQIIEIKLTEIMSLPLPETNNHTLSSKSTQTIFNFIEEKKVDVLGIGPGLSLNSSTQVLIRNIVKRFKGTIILDADGITAFSKGNIKKLKERKGSLIITPHLGEFSRLINKSKHIINRNREEITRQFAQEYSLICVLKGYRTIVTDGKVSYVNPTGNPGMATAGTGDVLTGIITGLVAQGYSSLEASIGGVYIHGLAGDVAVRFKGEMCLIASDMIDFLPLAIEKVCR